LVHKAAEEEEEEDKEGGAGVGRRGPREPSREGAGRWWGSNNSQPQPTCDLRVYCRHVYGTTCHAYCFGLVSVDFSPGLCCCLGHVVLALLLYLFLTTAAFRRECPEENVCSRPVRFIHQPPYASIHARKRDDLLIHPHSLKTRRGTRIYFHSGKMALFSTDAFPNHLSLARRE